MIVVSADVTPRQRERLLAEGARDYLAKPVELERFYQLVDGLLAQPRR